LLSGELYEPTSKLAALVTSIRARKGLKDVIPKHVDYIDRL